MMDCFNYNCPFYNKTSSCCECIACPNRYEAYTTTYVSDRIPTIDVVPAMHGHWIYESNSCTWVCSRCGRGVNTNPEGIDLYCYHCGAKMDEKE